MLSLLVLAATPAAALPTAAPTPFEYNAVTFGAQHPVLLTIIQVLFILTSVILIALMSMQTTKNEGLSGSIGGRSESAYRGRLGFDQQLTRFTGSIASVYVVLAIAYFLVTR